MGWVQNLKELKILNLNLAFQTGMKATCQDVTPHPGWPL